MGRLHAQHEPQNSILTLSSGGIRGIVELAILSRIEKVIGLGIPIQDLFDLVIGTSTGTVIILTHEFAKIDVPNTLLRWYYCPRCFREEVAS